MPVTTRSQSLKIAEKARNEKSVAKKPIFCSPSKVRPDQSNLLPWFSSVIAESIGTITFENNRRKNLKFKAETMTSFLPHHRDELTKKSREIYFANVRRVTELMYFVSEYLPTVYAQSPSKEIDDFTVTVYNKIQEMYNTIRLQHHPVTEDELKTIKTAIDVLQDTELNIIRFIPEGTEFPRRRKYIHIAAVDKYIPSVELTNSAK